MKARERHVEESRRADNVANENQHYACTFKRKQLRAESMTAGTTLLSAA